MIRILLIIFTYFSLSVFVFADTITKIEIKGNQRLSDESIIIFSGLSINQDYNSPADPEKFDISFNRSIFECSEKNSSFLGMIYPSILCLVNCALRFFITSFI